MKLDNPFIQRFKLAFKRSFGLKLAAFILLFWLLISLAAPIISNEYPLWCYHQNQHYFPAFSSETMTYKINGKTLMKKAINWKNLSDAKMLMPPISHSPKQIHLGNEYRFLPPFSKVNGDFFLLGTRSLGQDLAAGLIHGSRISIGVGLSSMLLAMCIGIVVGLLGGYFGNNSLKLNTIQLLILPILLFLLFFYARVFSALWGIGATFICSLIGLFLSIQIFQFLKKFRFKKRTIPLDTFLSRLTELFVGLPKLILILAISTLFKPSILGLVLVIGLTCWTAIARFARAEVLRLKNLDFIDSLKILGLKPWQIIFKHLLPNALPPLIVAFAFGLASVILIESSLSFLGIGIPNEFVTWGSLLTESRGIQQSWWIILFPGLALFSLVASLMIFGTKLQKVLTQ